MNIPSSFKVLHTKTKIDERVRALASSISRDYEGKNPLFIGVLKGSLIFMSDLIRHLDYSVEVDFVKASSYGEATISSKQPHLVHGLSTSVVDRDVLIIEDIVDTGFTINYLMGCLRDKGAASLKLCALLDKQVKRAVSIEIDYLGMSVPDKFIVGYGLDYKEHYRGLNQLYIM